MSLLSRLFLLIFVLCCGLLLFEINSLNEEYATLVEEGVLELKLIQNTSFNSNRRHILFYNIIHEKDPQQQVEYAQQWAALKVTNTKLYDSTLKMNRDSYEKQKLVQRAQSARKTYNDFCESRVLLALRGENQDTPGNLKTCDSLFANYQQQINNLFVSGHETISTSNSTLTEKASRVTKRTLFLTLLPVISIAIVIAIVYLLLRFYFSENRSYY